MAAMGDEGDPSTSLPLSDSVAQELEQLISLDAQFVAQLYGVVQIADDAPGSLDAPCSYTEPDSHDLQKASSKCSEAQELEQSITQDVKCVNQIADDAPGFLSAPDPQDAPGSHDAPCSYTEPDSHDLQKASSKCSEAQELEQSITQDVKCVNQIADDAPGSLSAPDPQDAPGSHDAQDSQDQQEASTSDQLQESKSLKRKRQPEMWARTVSKKKREAGKEYQNGQNKVMPARRVKHVDCSCSFKCTKKSTEEQRQAIFDKFWLLNDDEKGSFYSKFTERKETERKRTEKEVSRRQFSMLYYLEFDSVKTRVCKSFFLATLDISATRIQYFHSNLVDKSTGVPLERSKGKHPKKCVSTDDVQLVKDHINSFPRVESHYCRQRTKREYLCANLNVALMYDLYVQFCEEKGNTPVKIHKYRQIFQTEFNISFLMPKSDRCDKCEEYANRKKESQVFTEEESAEIEKHVFLKNDCYEERKRDREGVSAVLCFDMENVIQLPRANVSNFYYKRKLSFFNLTVHSSVDKTVYCCVWPESLGGRGGNEIASGLLKVLSRFVEDHPDVTEIILWSDSCVPQNRNAMMVTALKSFLVSHPNVTKITQKFSESGHSQIQEVDNAHSCIEKALNKSEVFSPVSLVRVLMAVRKKPQLRVLQMCKKDFLSFDKICKKLFFSKVPFTRVKQIMLEPRLQEFVSFKFEHGTPEFSCVNVTLSSIHHMKRKGKAQEKKEHFVSIAEVPLLSSKNTLCKEKVNDLKSMLKYMPAVDVQYYEPILK